LNRKKNARDDDVERYESKYIRMARAIFKVCQRQCVPLYSSRFSRRDFTLWQHIALIALMQRIRKSYREYANDFLAVATRLVRASWTYFGCLYPLSSGPDFGRLRRTAPT
jgi:hypothetical protein